MDFMTAGIRQRNIWQARAFNKHGELLWEEEFENAIVDEGADEALNTCLRNQTPETNWYVGLAKTSSMTVAAGDTLATHAGWTEAIPGTDYTGNRQGVTFAAPSNPAGTGRQSVGSQVSFPILTTTTFYGAFVCSAATGTSGVLFAAGNFGSARALSNGDTLQVTVTVVFDTTL